ncbi:MAG: hypothetical protein JW894_10760 [Bacteroidales bacterium]|nr:hypothetical protein [Bacteroidales bacterium]
MKIPKILYRHLFLSFAAVFIQIGILFSNTIKVEHLFKNTGLSESYILSICKDSYGFIWLGTYNGVYRYNGYDCISPFNRKADSSLLNNKSVHVIYEDIDSNLWFGSETGLFKFNRKSGVVDGFHYGTTEQTLSNEHIRTITQHGDKYYIGSYGGGLIIYYPLDNRFESYQVSDTSSSYPDANRINAFLRDRQNNIWIGTELGIYTFDEKQKEYKRLKSKGNWPENKIINCFYEDQAENIWIGTWDNGLYKYNKETELFTHFKYQDETPNTYSRNIRAILSFDNKNIWLASIWEGLFNLNNETNEINKIQFATKEPKINVSLWTMLKDKGGVIWLGGFGGGLYKYSPIKNQFKSYPENTLAEKQFSETEVSAFAEDSHGKIYVGTIKQGVYRYDPINEKVEHIINLPGSLQNIIRTLYADHKGRIWVGAQEYLSYIHNNTLKTYASNHESETSIGRNGVYAIHFDKSDNLWAGIWGWGLYKLEKQELSKHNPEDALFILFRKSLTDTNSVSDNVIWAIEEDKKGNLYLGTAYTLDYYDKKTGIFNHLINTTPSSIYIDEEDILWCGTFGSGLLKYVPWDNKFEFYSEDYGLQSNIINGVIKGKPGELILVTNIGISRFIIDSKQFVNYNAKSDLGINLIQQHAYIRLKNGTILIGGDAGIISFKPELLIDQQTTYPVYITDIKIFNRSILEENRIYDLSDYTEFDFSYKDKMISFEFAALNYSSPEKTKYAYKLEGFDDDWIVTDATNRLATYTNLKSGEYIFRIRSTNYEGLWGENENMMRINIKPPFYLSLLFKIFIAGIIVFLSIFFYNKKINSIKNTYKVKEESLQSKVEITAMEMENTFLHEELLKKNKELASNTAKLIAKNQALVNMKNAISNLKNEVSQDAKGKLIELHQLVVKNLDEESNWEKYNHSIDLLQDNFISRFSSEYPSVTHKDLKICGYIRMNMSNQQIAEQLNITLRSLEMARYRIRKKIKLPREINLNDFILKY